MQTRAQLVAARTAAPYVARGSGSVNRLALRHGADLAYVVSRTRELVMRPAEMLHVHPGLWRLKRRDGLAHPLIRALQPPGATPLQRIVDGTLGLAGDALHASDSLEVEVVGLESSPAVFCLLEEGLARMAGEDKRWSQAASRISARLGDAVELLGTMEDDSASVVYLDPMFGAPRAAAFGYGIFRMLARHTPLSQQLVAEAWRVAKRRVVLKVAGADFEPAVSAGPGWNRRVRGKAVDYLVLEGELEVPEYEHPTRGDGPVL